MLNKGFTDSPALKDNFNISKYIDGLATFIKNCNTPMTIAVQGDWGTGKTSIMTIIRNKLRLEGNLHQVWFNTWQFSQFNLGDKLPLMILNKLINEISLDKESQNFKYMKKAMLGITDAVLKHISGGNLDIASFIEEEENLIETIEKIRTTFQNLVDEKAGKNGRVVIFIDDLDRVEPQKAVELLEVLKIFLDCEKCVFVLAIDYSVVTRGVKAKYGSDFDESKGKNFFDKIIQVPFKMPVASYNINLYTKKCFEEIDLFISDEELPQYINLIKFSIGNNPRSMKRLFNSFLLLTNIANEEVLKDNLNKKILFALLCMQSSYEEVYNYIASNRLDIDGEFFKELKNQKSNIFNELEMNEKEIEDFLKFSKEFYKLLDRDNNGNIDEDTEISDFRKVLNFSTVTSSSAEIEETDVLWDYRRKNKEIARSLREGLKKKRKIELKEYYKRKGEGIGNWWLFINSNENQKELREKALTFELQYIFSPNLENGKLDLSIDIYNSSNEELEELTSVIGDNPFEVLNIKPEIQDDRLSYNNIITVKYNDKEAEKQVFNLIEESYKILEKYF